MTALGPGPKPHTLTSHHVGFSVDIALGHELCNLITVLNKEAWQSVPFQNLIPAAIFSFYCSFLHKFMHLYVYCVMDTASEIKGEPTTREPLSVSWRDYGNSLQH